MKIEKSLIKEFTEEIAERITKRTILALQQVKNTLSGDDSGLKNAWDEICVQVQYKKSSLWSAYDETVQSFVFAYTEELKSHEKLALWLQTEQGWSWAYDCDGQTDEYPSVFVEDIVEYITQQYIYRKAHDWSNNRIKSYLNKTNGE